MWAHLKNNEDVRLHRELYAAQQLTKPLLGMGDKRAVDLRNDEDEATDALSRLEYFIDGGE